MTPLVVQITASGVVPASEVAARIERIAALPRASRERYIVQLRDPELDSRALWALAVDLRERTRAAGCRFVCNDRLDIALAAGADGVHLGRRSVSVADARRVLGPSALVSVSAHAVADALAAARAGADMVLLSPIFASPGKGPPLGLGALAEARRALDGLSAPRPVLVSLGGVDASVVSSCLEAGAEGVAAIRADLGSTLAEALGR